jgi:predicted DNA binding CopG/RHH family protein
MRISKKKAIPKFASEGRERDFWAEHDSADYVDWSIARKGVFPQLKPSTRTISLRLPEALLEDLKYLANKRDVPYQSLLKVYLAERVEHELGSRSYRAKDRAPLEAAIEGAADTTAEQMAIIAAEQTEALAELSKLIALQAELAAQSAAPSSDPSELASAEIETDSSQAKGKTGDARTKRSADMGKKG